LAFFCPLVAEAPAVAVGDWLHAGSAEKAGPDFRICSKIAQKSKYGP
jgi:hypothetical protein